MNLLKVITIFHSESSLVKGGNISNNLEKNSCKNNLRQLCILFEINLICNSYKLKKMAV